MASSRHAVRSASSSILSEGRMFSESWVKAKSDSRLASFASASCFWKPLKTRRRSSAAHKLSESSCATSFACTSPSESGGSARASRPSSLALSSSRCRAFSRFFSRRCARRTLTLSCSRSLVSCLSVSAPSTIHVFSAFLNSTGLSCAHASACWMMCPGAVPERIARTALLAVPSLKRSWNAALPSVPTASAASAYSAMLRAAQHLAASTWSGSSSLVEVMSATACLATASPNSAANPTALPLSTVSCASLAPVGLTLSQHLAQIMSSMPLSWSSWIASAFRPVSSGYFSSKYHAISDSVCAVSSGFFSHQMAASAFLSSAIIQLTRACTAIQAASPFGNASFHARAPSKWAASLSTSHHFFWTSFCRLAASTKVPSSMVHALISLHVARVGSLETPPRERAPFDRLPSSESSSESAALRSTSSISSSTGTIAPPGPAAALGVSPSSPSSPASPASPLP
mmetsp:Transcript_29600/g.60635  ORF Transcript_29600/g.60635 Transcript_29600/m.60635 type:complete len:459 (-) Transcript_29600:810-2186(-)